MNTYVITIARYAGTINTHKVCVCAESREAAEEIATAKHWEEHGRGTQIQEVEERMPTATALFFGLVTDWREQ